MNKHWFMGVIGAAVLLTAVGATACSGDSGSKTVRERVEDCVALDGNHEGFEKQIRDRLNDPGSMETHATRSDFTPGSSGGSSSEVLILMNYSAKNRIGGRVRTEARGLLNIYTCQVRILDWGF